MSIKIFWGDLLRKIRIKNGLTQEEVAKLLRMSRQNYGYLENGRNRPTAEQLAILSNVYDLDLYRYALKSMPIDYVAEQIEFKSHIQHPDKDNDERITRDVYGNMQIKRGRKRKHVVTLENDEKDIDLDSLKRIDYEETSIT